jgi:hypothetical protein
MEGRGSSARPDELTVQRAFLQTRLADDLIAAAYEQVLRVVRHIPRVDKHRPARTARGRKLARTTTTTGGRNP